MPHGFPVREEFYRRATRPATGAAAAPRAPLAEHVPDMLRYRRHAEAADVVHYQWLPLEALDAFLLRAARRACSPCTTCCAREARRAGAWLDAAWTP